jgi:hypothetical protein
MAVRHIGGAQVLLPVVGLQWLCDPASFESIAYLDVPSSLSCQLNNGFKLVSASGVITVKLGTEFFIYKYIPHCLADCEDVAVFSLTSLSSLSDGEIRRNFLIMADFFKKLCDLRRSELEEIIVQIREAQSLKPLSQELR